MAEDEAIDQSMSRQQAVRGTGWTALVLSLLLIIGPLSGCGGNATTTTTTTNPARTTTGRSTSTPRAANPAAVAPITNTDPCATRMHDIGGWLLLYFSRHNDLPADLDELGAVVDVKDPAAFACPVSGLPYVYNPGGIELADRGTWVILHDAAPSHSNMRWSITIAEPRPGVPLVAKVIALPESFFLLHPPPRAVPLP